MISLPIEHPIERPVRISINQFIKKKFTRGEEGEGGGGQKFRRKSFPILLEKSFPRIPSQSLEWKGVARQKETAKRRGNAAERRWYAGGGGRVGGGGSSGGGRTDQYGGRGGCGRGSEGSFEGVERERYVHRDSIAPLRP